MLYAWLVLGKVKVFQYVLWPYWVAQGMGRNRGVKSTHSEAGVLRFVC